MSRRRNSTSGMGDVLVTGPGCDGRNAPSTGAAISLAQTLACRATRPGTWYVRTPDGKIRHAVERGEDGTILVHTNGRRP